jgi:AbrB family looped-hinge helix DNA binding protein
MQSVTVSSKGQIAIPKEIRTALNLSPGMKLNLEVKGHKIVLSKEPAWKELAGMCKGQGLMEDFAEFRRKERELEDSRP